MKAEKLLAERERLSAMLYYENKYSDYALIAGTDEAGRGPLAGPVVAGACILPAGAEILYLNDSKKLSEKRRESLFPEIKEKALSWGVGIIGPERIDEINILNATYEAMRQALFSLSPAPEIVLCDAVHIPDLPWPQVKIIKGDTKSQSIAAASILAKVTRDHLMIEYDEKYPGYGFAKHKGYGTKAHYEALISLGPCPIHRKTFLKTLEAHRK